MGWKMGEELEITAADLDKSICDIVAERLSAEFLKQIGVVKIRVADYKDDFFRRFVEQPIESGSFGQLLYESQYILKTSVKKLNDGWLTSEAEPGQFESAAMKELFHEFKKNWENDFSAEEKAVLENPEQAFGMLENWLDGSVVKYAESYSEQTNPTPLVGVEPVGDLKLPIDLYKVCPKYEELFYNYIRAPGITVPWTYVYGPRSGTVFHFEDALLASANLNCGPGIKYWICVPKKDLFKVLNHYSLHKLDDCCGHEFSNKRVSPLTKSLMEAGVEILFFAQKPGELMFLDCAVLHEVINIQWGISIAKNVLTDSWAEYGQIGLWLRKECQNCSDVMTGYELYKDVTERFSSLMKRIKPHIANAPQKDQEMLDYLEDSWIPVYDKFADQFNVCRQGVPISWTLPKNQQPIPKTLTLYSDYHGLKRVYGGQIREWTKKRPKEDQSDAWRPHPKIIPIAGRKNRYHYQHFPGRYNREGDYEGPTYGEEPTEEEVAPVAKGHSMEQMKRRRTHGAAKRRQEHDENVAASAPPTAPKRARLVRLMDSELPQPLIEESPQDSTVVSIQQIAIVSDGERIAEPLPSPSATKEDLPSPLSVTMDELDAAVGKMLKSEPILSSSGAENACAKLDASVPIPVT